MATLIKQDGTREEITPANGKKFTLVEMQTLVGGYIEMAQTNDGQYLVIDEEGKIKGKDINQVASAMYRFFPHDYIVGDAILASRREVS
jgi:hypothetical protein